jgi:hypothetical protein
MMTPDNEKMTPEDEAGLFIMLVLIVVGAILMLPAAAWVVGYR